jgi:uncharacterized protein (TIRG00374 family)
MQLDNQVNQQKVFQTLNTKRVWLPLLLGTGVVIYFLSTDQDLRAGQLHLVRLGNWPYILAAIGAVVLRDLIYIYRIRILTHNKLSWLSCLYVIILWEFSSAVTPSAVGGTLIAVFLLLKEGVSLGRSLAYVMVTAILDNLFFILMAPLGYYHAYNYLSTSMASLEKGIHAAFWISYLLITLYTIMMAFALFVKPAFFKWALVKLTHIRFLSRWKEWATKQGDDIMMASQALQGEKWIYWVQIGVVTMLVWTARYGILNLLIAAYVPVSWLDHLMIFGKHIIMWVTMLISPTPGSSGTAEFFFKQLYGELLGQYTLIMAIVWRMITYYLYLIAGVIVLPRWLKGAHLRKVVRA